MVKEKRLGTGLATLLGRLGATEQPNFNLQPTDIPDAVDADGILQRQLANKTPSTIDLLLVDPNPYQPRREFDETGINQLAASLQTHGLLQPIVVRKAGGRFQIVVGERRFRAARQIGWSEISVHIIDADDRAMLELAIIENIQREDLNDIDKATALARYLEMYGGTHEELAKQFAVARPTVTNLLRLLDLPQMLQDAVREGNLTQGHARALLTLKDQKHEQLEVAARAQAEGWSVRDTETFVRELVDTGKKWNVVDKEGKTRPVETVSEQVRKLEEEFRLRLGMKVKLTQTDKSGKGKLVISFTDHAEFERLHQMVCRSDKKRAHG